MLSYMKVLPKSSEIICIRISEINSIIRESEVYKDLVCEEKNGFITLSNKYYFKDFEHLFKNNPEEILNILRYWNINPLPYEVINYLFPKVMHFRLSEDLINFFDEISIIMKTKKEHVCSEAAKIGSLNLLKVAYENGCPFDKVSYSLIHINFGTVMYESTCNQAASNGNLDCLIYSHKNGCSIDKYTIEAAARDGHLHCIKYLHKNDCPWDEDTCRAAALGGHLECLTYLHKNGCDWDEGTCSAASTRGHLNCLIYACENGCFLDEYIYWDTRKMGYLDCLEYLENKIMENKNIETYI